MSVVFPASNVVFAAQGDLDAFPPDKDPSVSPNLLTSRYGGWQAVENASLALAESANLILLPGRHCSNGKPAPTQRADWIKYGNDRLQSRPVEKPGCNGRRGWNRGRRMLGVP